MVGKNRKIYIIDFQKANMAGDGTNNGDNYTHQGEPTMRDDEITNPKGILFAAASQK
jgi:predicted Ser/Thr protein kinase